MGLKIMCVYISVSVCLFLDTLMWQTRTQRGSCGIVHVLCKALKLLELHGRQMCLGVSIHIYIHDC